MSNNTLRQFILESMSNDDEVDLEIVNNVAVAWMAISYSFFNAAMNDIIMMLEKDKKLDPERVSDYRRLFTMYFSDLDALSHTDTIKAEMGRMMLKYHPPRERVSEGFIDSIKNIYTKAKPIFTNAAVIAGGMLTIIAITEKVMSLMKQYKLQVRQAKIIAKSNAVLRDFFEKKMVKFLETTFDGIMSRSIKNPLTLRRRFADFINSAREDYPEVRPGLESWANQTLHKFG